MSTVVEIESAIQGLPKEDFWKLAEWFDQERSKTWEEQMAVDAEAGNLDFLFEEAQAARTSGKTVPWPVQA
ncbi:hypothetical protein WJU23_07775 [Prosthecobacter sp. SYSU 5D2]|uniref:hypothetical protein n=1 Tax=Prosthecobacter sp. SYSU 5D2 TaxID=3134134 RepID=UPI0031FEDC48